MDVFCFDFDGVICDSAPETAVTAWQGCRELWPAPGTSADPAPLPEALQARFCRLRPVMHTGFEAIPLMRLIEEGDVSDAQFLADFPALRDGLIAREGLRTADLQQRFGAIRDRLIAADQAAWLGWNRFYPGMGEALSAAAARGPAFIITTKQERFAALLLRHEGVALPPERIFGLEAARSKPELLQALLARPEHDGATFHFIEDRLETLQAVIATPGLGGVRLYLADWGYNTPAQREEAVAIKRIQVVSMQGFRAMHDL
ncbi:MAG TPA: HAD family hydrolase [bacterium]|nr:HAD family hydrolase [bacterium]